MTNDELIRQTVRETISELRRAGMLKENRLNSFKKTEKVLFELEHWKQCDSKRTKRFVAIVERALDEIRDDEYFEMIPMRYFEGQTLEQIAEYFDLSVSSVSEIRRRLVNRIRPIIFSDDYIAELFSM